LHEVDKKKWVALASANLKLKAIPMASLEVFET